MYRKTYVEIDEDILKRNTLEIISKYPNYKYYMAVLKNNAYHHGINIVNSLIESGINYIAVSSLDEAINLRKFNKHIPILVLEPINLEFINEILLNNITIMIENISYVKKLNKMKLSKIIKIHIKIDSGMNRLGFKEKDSLDEAIKIISNNKHLYLEGIFSHFATSGISDQYYDLQVKNFIKLTSNINLKEIPIIHFDRSLTLVKHKKLDFVTGVRLGIILFGFNGNTVINKNLKNKLRSIKRNIISRYYNISPTILENNLNIQTVFKLYSEVIAIRKVYKGERVGYNGSYQVNKNAYIATIPIGYADGITKDFEIVAINNKRYKIVSDAMDMIMVLVDDKVKINDKVEIFGESISIKEVTSRLHINSYHLFNQISNRVPRIHKSKKEIIEIKY